MYIASVVISVYTCICTIVFTYKYRNLHVKQIESNFYGMGDIIFLIFSGFEFVQLLSLAPNLIDDDSTDMIKKFSIYPMEYLNLEDDILYTQMYMSYAF